MKTYKEDAQLEEKLGWICLATGMILIAFGVTTGAFISQATACYFLVQSELSEIKDMINNEQRSLP